MQNRYGGARMESFIQTHQYQYIKNQTENLLQSQLTTNDAAVMEALKSITQEKVTGIFDNLTDEQKQLVEQIQNIEDETEGIFFLSRLKQHVVPFPRLEEQTIKSLFPKVKKLPLPDLNQADWNETSYLGWNDSGSGRKYIVAYVHNELIGIIGNSTPSRHPGICSICHEQEEVDMFTTSLKGVSKEESITRGQYICRDSQKCNENLKEVQPLFRFIELMT